MPSETATNIHAKAEADAVRELAYRAATPKHIGDCYHTLVVPPDHEVEYIDTELLEAIPLRKRGTVELHDAASFAEFVNRHKDAEMTTIYADAFEFGFVGVLNDAKGASASPLAGTGARWTDHRATLTLRPTEEWTRWAAADGRMFAQEEFAEFVEDGIEEIHKPAAAEMLELASTFHATTSATFRQATVLQSGERKLNYDESIEARGGRAGEMSVPATFELALRPFEGSEAYKVVARLRYRVTGGKLAIGYKLVRPDYVQRDAFDGARAAIDADTGVPMFAGTPPEGVGR